MRYGIISQWQGFHILIIIFQIAFHHECVILFLLRNGRSGHHVKNKNLRYCFIYMGIYRISVSVYKN